MINTAFFNTIKTIREKWPVVVVSEENFNNNTIADEHKTHNYVWLVNEKHQNRILSTFDWSYKPLDNKNNIHLFPVCFKDSKRPADWNGIKLVPVSKDNDEVIKSKIIAGYLNTPLNTFYYTMYERGLINKIVSKPKELRYRVIKSKNSLHDLFKDFQFQKYNKDYILFVDVDVSLDMFYDFELPDDDEPYIYHYAVKHTSTGLTYADNSVMLVPCMYIYSIQQGNEIDIEHKVINDVVGELNDVSDPEFTWIRSYSTAGLILQNKFLYKQRKFTNKILTSYLSSVGHKLSRYIIDGCNQATKDLENNVDIDFTDFAGMSKRFVEYMRAVTNADTTSKSKLDMIKRIYGEDSEQYKRMLMKSESV